MVSDKLSEDENESKVHLIDNNQKIYLVLLL